MLSQSNARIVSKKQKWNANSGVYEEVILFMLQTTYRNMRFTKSKLQKLFSNFVSFEFQKIYHLVSQQKIGKPYMTQIMECNSKTSSLQAQTLKFYRFAFK